MGDIEIYIYEFWNVILALQISSDESILSSFTLKSCSTSYFVAGHEILNMGPTSWGNFVIKNRGIFELQSLLLASQKLTQKYFKLLFTLENLLEWLWANTWLHKRNIQNSDFLFKHLNSILDLK